MDLQNGKEDIEDLLLYSGGRRIISEEGAAFPVSSHPLSPGDQRGIMLMWANPRLTTL